MARVKKSRKVGLIGTPSVSKESRKKKSVPTTKNKNTKGNKSGSRNNVAETDANNPNGKKTGADPRLGSKKPIPLVVEAKSAASNKAKTAFFSPKQELQSIEEDPKLSSLLDLVDEGEKLDAKQQAYVEAKLARHKVLCDLLGISAESEEKQPSQQEDDLFEQFDTIDINKLK